MRFVSKVACAAVCAGLAGVSCAEGVAVLQNAGGRHGTEFDAAFATLGVEPVRYKDTVESVGEFLEAVGRFDLVLVSPLFNFSAGIHGKCDLAPLKRYIENGGMLVITDSSYEGVRAFFEPAVSGLVDFTTGKCTSSQWGVLGYAKNVEPIHPLRSFPNVLTDGDSWPHFETVPAGWTTIANCSEGKPVIAYRDVGRGCAVTSALRQPSAQAVENFLAYARFHKSGLAAKGFTMTPLRPGDGSLTLELASDAPAGSKLSFVVEGPQNKSVTFTTNVVSRTVTLGFNVPYRGPVSAELFLDSPSGRRSAYRRSAVMPPLFAVGPNAYRGKVSTARRVDAVRFPVSLEPDKEKLAGATVELTVFDSASNAVVTAEETLPKEGETPRKVWVSVPLRKSLAAGGYRIDGRLLVGGRECAKSSAAFEIVRPHLAQVVIDDDNTFLVNGKPFFPLGIYHTTPDRYPEIAKLGFNAQQFWKWNMDYDEFGLSRSLALAAGYGMRCFYESNHQSPGVYRELAGQLRDHPAMLGFYIADEPAEGFEHELDWRNRLWHELDPNHPTFIVSCRPDLFEIHGSYADVFGFDIYGDLKKFTDWNVMAEEKMAAHQPTICVPSARWEPKEFDDVRLYAYIAIVHNVRGILWYCWSQAGGGPLGVGIHDKPEAYAFYTKLTAELKSLMPGLLARRRRTFIEGSVHGIVLGEGGGNRYLIAVNASDETVEADFEVAELKGVAKVALPLGEKGAAETVEPGKVKRAFKPREVLVWRW